MASINGISVRNLNEFEDHEGQIIHQGELFLDNEKIGFWSQDNWGGPDQFRFEKKYSYERMNKAVTAANPDKAIRGSFPDRGPYVIDYDLSLLLEDYINLTYDEKEYDAAIKEGYSGVLIATDGHHQYCWKLPASYTVRSDQEIMKMMAESLNKVKESFLKENEYTKHTFKVYRSKKEFHIGAPIQLADILRENKKAYVPISKALKEADIDR